MFPRYSCLFVLLLASTVVAEEASQEAKVWYRKWVINLTGDGIAYDYIPKEHRLIVEGLYEASLIVQKFEPTDQDVINELKRLKFVGDSVSDAVRAWTVDKIRARMLMEENRDQIKTIIKAGYEKRFKALELPDKWDKTKGMYLVFIPFPSANKAGYELCEAFMLKACAAAEKSGTKVVIIRSLFGVATTLDSLDAAAPAERENISRLDESYQPFIKSGTVVVLDSIPQQRSAPWVFAIKDGAFTQGGHLADWAADEDIFLKTIESSTSNPEEAK